MVRLNDYFIDIKPASEKTQKWSLCGKLEAIIGNYLLLGGGVSGNGIETLYYDSSIGFYDAVPTKKENIVAYIVENETVAFVLEDMLPKLKKDTEEYGLVFIPVKSFDTEEFYIDRKMEMPSFLKGVTWIDDDFMSDENIEFDFNAFEIIDSGTKYINPNHFSIAALVNYLWEEYYTNNYYCS